MKSKGYITLIILSLISIRVSAQSFQVDAQIDSTIIYIGQQCNITFSISQKPDLKVITPVFKDTITKGIEIIGRSIDTIVNKDGYITVRQNYLITSFDSALYYIPEFPFVANGDTIYSYSLSLKVLTVPIDTTSQEIAIADIKPIVDAPIDWRSLIVKILIGVLTTAIVLIIYILVRRYIKKKKLQAQTIEKYPEVVKTCDEIALEKLEIIRREKIWQAGKLKEYYTDVTDVLREYIEARFGVVTFERTSSEIVDSLSFIQKTYPNALNLLSRIFDTSDMVKFAKLVPDFNMHTDTLKNAVEFVDITKEGKTSSDQLNTTI